jgi:hypothetical protein
LETEYEGFAVDNLEASEMVLAEDVEEVVPVCSHLQKKLIVTSFIQEFKLFEIKGTW